MFSLFNTQTKNEDQDITNNCEYVVTYDNFPYIIYNNKEDAIKFMWYKAREFADDYEDKNHDYRVRIFQEDNQIIVTRQYKFFIISYEEYILRLGVFKTDKIDKEN